MKLLTSILFVTVLFSCQNSNTQKTVVLKSHTDSINEKLSVEMNSGGGNAKTLVGPATQNGKHTMHIFQMNDSLYGFNILQDNKTLIHQEIIPAIQGKHGFYSERDAQLVGELMLSKISQGSFPPSISQEDLKRLGIKIEK